MSKKIIKSTSLDSPKITTVKPVISEHSNRGGAFKAHKNQDSSQIEFDKVIKSKVVKVPTKEKK